MIIVIQHVYVLYLINTRK